MKVSFGIINFNRLFYLKSCAESLMESVEDYPDVEFICIDDNSKEPGTKEYLKSLEDRGWKVVDQEEFRTSKKETITEYDDSTHINPFSEALNIFNDMATGDLIVPLQGDMQFVRKNWLKGYVDFFEERDDVFSILLDAQRRKRLENSHYQKFVVNGESFAIEAGRNIGGAGDVVLNKELVDKIGGWHTNHKETAEELFAVMAAEVFYGSKKVFVPWVPPAIVIATDKRGTNARVRGNKRYGDYWEAKDNLYYEWVDVSKLANNESHPVSIEEMAVAHGEWELPLDELGQWKKLGSSIDTDDFEIIE